MKKSVANFNQLYTDYHADVYRFAYWISGSSEDAKDIAAETFIRLWTAKSDLKAQTVKGYLLTIARNIYLQGRRKQKQQIELDNTYIDPSPSPCDIAESQSEFSQFVKALQTLPEIDRSILIMKVYEGLTYNEISKLVGLSISSLKVKIHRARMKLALINSREKYNEN